MISIRDSRVTVPEDYSAHLIDEVEKQYASSEQATEKVSGPNILVIVDESFADLSVFGQPVRASEEVIPFIRSLEENTIRGYALASVYGGNTANSEFEFLCGQSMAFLPDGSVPFQQFITQNVFSLPWVLKNYGYECIATHPYLASGWSRPSVYPRLGFDSFTFDEAYEGTEVIREYIADEAAIRYMIEQLEAPRECPLFLYCMTMQNHGPFNYVGDSFEQVLRLQGYQAQYPQAEQYLQLLNHTDQAIEMLITSLQDSPQKTVVLFFGDHMPRIEMDFCTTLLGSEFESLDQQVLQYKVPFFIWANYDLPEQTLECTSLIYLAGHLLEAAGIELPPYYAFLRDMEDVIPSINAIGYYSVDANGYVPIEEATNVEAEWVQKAQMLMYNSLFDEDNLSTLFYGQYLPVK